MQAKHASPPPDQEFTETVGPEILVRNKKTEYDMEPCVRADFAIVANSLNRGNDKLFK